MTDKEVSSADSLDSDLSATTLMRTLGGRRSASSPNCALFTSAFFYGRPFRR
jgi:hypothetical protein